MAWDQSGVITLGGGLTTDMPSPEGPWMCVHACVGVSMTDNKSKRKKKTFEMKKVCLCEPSPDLTDRQRQITHRPSLAPPLHFQKVNPNKRPMASLALFFHNDHSSIRKTNALQDNLFI